MAETIEMKKPNTEHIVPERIPEDNPTFASDENIQIE